MSKVTCLYLFYGLLLVYLSIIQSDAATNGVSATWTSSGWSGGYTAYLTITNNGTTAINGWSAKFTTAQQETSVWNGSISGPSANVYSLTPASWTTTLNARGGSVQIGFTFNGTPPQTPTNFVFNGQTVVLNGGGSSGTGSGSGPSTGTTTSTGTNTSTGTTTASGTGTTTGTTTSTGIATGYSSGTSGVIGFHFYYGVSPTSPEDSITLTGGNYTDLIMSNMVAGVMYGHLLREAPPGLQFNKDYLYGSIFGQLLQENIATEYYTSSSNLIDPSADQQAVMGVGQGGPYQINNYAADMVAGTYTPGGFSLINYVALQKNIGFTMATAGTQYTKATPASFNDKYYGPMLTAYFHFNDYRALQYVGGTSATSPWTPTSYGWTPDWQPYFFESQAAFKSVQGNQLEILLNVAYNAGYYASLFEKDVINSANTNASTVTSFNSFSNAWAGDSYQQYPYQVRGYLDQLYDNPTPSPANLNTVITPTNHVIFNMTQLAQVFSKVFQTLAYVNGSNTYVYISDSQATAAFNTALVNSSLTASSTLDLSNVSNRNVIFAVLDNAIGNLEENLNTSFSSTTSKQL